MIPLRAILFAILALPVAEVVVFLWAANAFGAFKTFFAMVAASLFGIAILANTGRTLFSRRGGISAGVRIEAGSSARLMTALSGLLLAIPGFLTDIAGLLLLLPFVRRWVISAFPRATRPADGVIDLNPAEWRRIPERKSRKRPGAREGS